MYKSVIRPFLFKHDPEDIHHAIVKMLKGSLSIPFSRPICRALFNFKHPKLEREVFGIKFPNPVGLAAGFDKDAKLIDEFAQMGFGHIEIGTVTPKGQPGNPRPRIFRLPEDQALINRMGFNNDGVEATIERLKKRSSSIIVGGNIGKNKVTPNEEAFEDYKLAFEALFPYVDYFTCNISSPNTPNLRELQEKEPLKKLLSEVKALNATKDQPKPILLKIAPDLTNEQLNDIIEIVQEVNIDGVIATNTTIERGGLQTTDNRIEEIGAGGLSGAPLRERSTEVIRYLHKQSNGAFPIVGVGGINSPEDAVEKMKAGAALVQIYSGFIYQGPSFMKKINKAILKAGL